MNNFDIRVQQWRNSLIVYGLLMSSSAWSQPTSQPGASAPHFDPNKVVIIDGLPVISSREPIVPPVPVRDAIPIIPAPVTKGGTQFSWRGSEYGISNGFWYQKVHVYDSHLQNKKAAYLLVLRMMQTRLLQMHESTDPRSRLEYALEPGDSYQKWGSQLELARAALEQMVSSQFSKDGKAPRRDASNWLPIDPRLSKFDPEEALIARNFVDARDAIRDSSGISLNTDYFKESILDFLPTAYMLTFSLRLKWLADYLDNIKNTATSESVRIPLMLLRSIVARGNAISVAAVGVPSVYYRLPIFPCSTEQKIKALPEDQRADAIRKCRDSYVGKQMKVEWGLANDVSFYVWTNNLEGVVRLSAGMITGLYNSRDFAKYWGRGGITTPVDVLANLFLPTGVGVSKTLANNTVEEWGQRAEQRGGGFASQKTFAPLLKLYGRLPLRLTAFAGIQFGRDDLKGEKIPAHLYAGVGIEPGRVIAPRPAQKGFVNIWHVSDFFRMISWSLERLSISLKENGTQIPSELTQPSTQLPNAVPPPLVSPKGSDPILNPQSVRQP
jgi:hypothetical protein